MSLFLVLASLFLCSAEHWTLKSTWLVLTLLLNTTLWASLALTAGTRCVRVMTSALKADTHGSRWERIRLYSTSGKRMETKSFTKTAGRWWCAGVSEWTRCWPACSNRSTMQWLKAKYGASLWTQTHHFAFAHEPDFISFKLNTTGPS